MPTIAIRLRQPVEKGFAAAIVIDSQAQYDITIKDPFDERQEQALEFYFEQWIRFPFDNQVIAKRSAESITAYGENLFGQIFADPEALSDYRQACRGGLGQVQFVIEGESPDFQALHWEALKDPKHPAPLAVECLFTRKRFQRGIPSIDLQPSATINLLVVTARPDEESDVGYRTISRPLIDAIHQAQLRVNVELLRPGTFQALADHLEGKTGYYHIIHFDAHGGLMTYDQFEQGASSQRYLFQARYGRRDLEPYAGLKAFLFLEGDTKGKADPVEAQELADLLTAKGIPICILNACQSGKQVREQASNTEDSGVSSSDSSRLSPPASPETSLGSRLMSAGVQMVVAMGYSVTVTAAALMMEKLYSELFAQKGIPEAIRLGRRELYNRKERRVYFNQVVDLEDWLLPVVYANRAVDFKLREFEPREKAEYLLQRRQRYRFERPTYGFVGRDLEILKIEKALLRHNVLLLRGMGGTGKTTLLNYLWEWWQTTNFVKDVFYFGYDTAAYTLQQILRVIGKGLYPDGYDFAVFEAMPLAAQMEDLAEKLRARPYALMLDNLESVTGQALAIQNTLPEVEQQAIREFLLLLCGGRTKVVLGSRSGEAWLAAAFTAEGRANVYTLGGLDPESRSVLAEKILAAQVQDPKRIEALRKDDALQRLMKLLAGYPLAMEVVLANLKQQSPQEILDALNAADVDLNVGGGERTNDILKCVEYSHSNLSPEAQKLLVCLAPFNSFVYRPGLENYGKQLKQLEPFQDYDFERFDDAVQEAIRWGLLSPINASESRLLNIQPIFPYFLRTKLNSLDMATRDALYDSFQSHYRSLAHDYNRLMLSKDSWEQKLGLFFCRLEYENLYSALQLSLSRQENVNLQQALCLTTYLELTGNKQGKLEFSQVLCSALEAYPEEKKTNDIKTLLTGLLDTVAIGNFESQNFLEARRICQEVLSLSEDLGLPGHLSAMTYHQLGAISQRLREYEQAKSYYQQALDIYSEYNEPHHQASTYHQLGLLAQELRKYEQAKSYYQQALDIYVEYNERHCQASTYYQLGVLAQELREYKQAKSYYQKSIDIYVEYNDRYNQADVYHQLGMLAQNLGEYALARLHYQEALSITIEYNDHYSQAITYHQLGNVAHKLREYAQAQSNYQKALDIYIEYNDRYNQAGTYHQLGIVVQDLQKYEQARSYYQQALDIYIEYDDRYRQAGTHHQLGMLAQKLREYEQARSNYQRALDIRVECNDRYEQAKTYYQLGKMAQELREYERARSYYQQALDICIEHDDHYHQATTYHELGMVTKELQEYEQAKSHYQQALNIYSEYNYRYEQSSTYYQLGIMALELREYRQARAYYQQALDICVEYDDHYHQAYNHRCLGRVAQDLQEYEQARSYYQQALDICIEYNYRYEQAGTYGQLGLLAEAQEDYSQARQHLQQALAIFAEFRDVHSVEITLQNLARIYQTTQDAGILADVAQCLNATVEEVRQWFEAQSSEAKSD